MRGQKKRRKIIITEIKGECDLTIKKMKLNTALEELLEAPWKKVLLPNWIAKPGVILGA